MILGTGTNIIQADTINIGLGKNTGNGLVQFASQVAGSPGTVSITSKIANSGASNITVVNNNGTGTAGGAVGTLELGGHVASVVANTLLIGNNNMTAGNAGGVSGTVDFNSGSFTVNTLSMGIRTGGGTGPATGTLTVGGGVFTLNAGSTFTLGSGSDRPEGTAARIQLNLNGGIFKSGANIVNGGGANTATINFNGGTLRAGLSSATFVSGLSSVNVQSGGAIIDTNGFNVTIAQPLLTTASTPETFTKLGAGTLTFVGADTYVGATAVNGGTAAGDRFDMRPEQRGERCQRHATAGRSGHDRRNGDVQQRRNAFARSQRTGHARDQRQYGAQRDQPHIRSRLPGYGEHRRGTQRFWLRGRGSNNLNLGTGANTLTVNRGYGFGVGTYTLINGFNVLNATNLPTVTPIAGVTMSPAVSGNALVLNVTAIDTSGVYKSHVDRFRTASITRGATRPIGAARIFKPADLMNSSFHRPRPISRRTTTSPR